MDFNEAFKRLIGHEGKYTRNTQDRGNWTTGIIGKGKLKGTKYGISAMSYPDLDIANLTLEQAREIYKRDFWDKIHIDLLPDLLKYDFFDIAVNAGTKTPVVLLQEALKVKADGDFGKITQQALKDFKCPIMLTTLFHAERLEYYAQMSDNNWNHFGKGWINRSAENLRMLANNLNLDNKV